MTDIIPIMAWMYEILQQKDIDEILRFEEARFKEIFPDDIERKFRLWHSSAREESLKHYIPLGWSFKICDEDGHLMGFFLAQPLLFFSGYTQVLWVEYLATTSLKARDSLIELIYRLSREKHLQGVFFPSDDSKLVNALSSFKPIPWEGRIFIATTK
ncbi:MAG: hypothetical protein NZ480_02065 [Bdellovibrionaceae bacterium]|nr:hypothetical protein [Pseudobdellovibrionaceae bacterium]MDW8190526.1 hypothetical protein [Pseudobdellovibrionaceae bacterium]